PNIIESTEPLDVVGLRLIASKRATGPFVDDPLLEASQAVRLVVHELTPAGRRLQPAREDRRPPRREVLDRDLAEALADRDGVRFDDPVVVVAYLPSLGRTDDGEMRILAQGRRHIGGLTIQLDPRTGR